MELGVDLEIAKDFNKTIDFKRVQDVYGATYFDGQKEYFGTLMVLGNLFNTDIIKNLILCAAFDKPLLIKTSYGTIEHTFKINYEFDFKDNPSKSFDEQSIIETKDLNFIVVFDARTNTIIYAHKDLENSAKNEKIMDDYFDFLDKWFKEKQSKEATKEATKSINQIISSLSEDDRKQVLKQLKEA